MQLNIGVIMDPIGSINVAKDSTLAMLLEAQRRGATIHYMELEDLYLEDGSPWARMRKLTVADDKSSWYHFVSDPEDRRLSDLDVVLMRKDPPFNMDYIYATYLLERAEAEGVLLVNRARSLRDANEKLFTAWFPQCTPPTTVSANMDRLRRFVGAHRDVIIKPLDGMGGASVFRIRDGDPNTSVIIETLTARGHRLAMVQRFVPEIAAGDKRILVVDGKPVPFALARIPRDGETRGNLAAGGKGVPVALTERDRWICDQVGEALVERGLIFVGLDVIGDFLTEINVTSPTCIRELDQAHSLNIAGLLFDAIEQRL